MASVEHDYNDKDSKAPPSVGVLFVGAGPHALTCILRLLETQPMADKWVDPNFRAHPAMRGRQKVRRVLQARKSSRQRVRREQLLKGVLVVDASAKEADRRWMARWHAQFGNLHIPYLRSPTDVHPGPVDPQTLDMDAERKHLPLLSTQSSPASMALVQIDGLPHSRADFHGPRHVPSTPLFQEFCDTLASTYNVDGQSVVHAGRVTDIKPCVAESGGRYFDVLCAGASEDESDDKPRRVHAKAVVLAIGHSNCPRIPDWAAECASPRIEHVWDMVSGEHAKPLRDIARGRQGETVVVVGGGLTSAYAVEAFVAEGATVVHLVRNTLLAKPFDVDMKWAGKRRAAVVRHFQGLGSPEERAEYNRSVRERGSLTHTALAKLRDLEENCAQYTLLEDTSVLEAEDTKDGLHLFLDSGELLHVSWVCLCTGSALDVDKDPLLQRVRQHLPTKTVDGLPTLDERLRWNPEWDLFVMGAYAGLQLGPDALNLAGARRGAARVAPQLAKHL